MRWSFTAPIALASTNAIIRATRAGMDPRRAGGMYRSARNKLAFTVRMAARAVPVPQATRRRHVTITRLIGKGQRQWDDDAMALACKALRDAMQLDGMRGGRYVPGAGLIVDDSPTWATFAYAQERAADGQPGVRIEITEEDQP